MRKEKIVKIKDGFFLKKIAGEYTAIPFGGNVEDVGAMVSLNETGAFLWEILSKDTDENALETALVEAYGIDASLAKEAVCSFIALLKEHDLLAE